jgi:hypothetical protein
MSAGSHLGRQDGGDATPLSQRSRQSPSPAPRHWSSGHNIIIKRVVEKSSAAIVYPTLIRTNYSEWALEILVNLQDAIELGTDDYREDRSTLVALLRAVPEEMQAGLARKENTTEAWKAIRAAQMGAIGSRRPQRASFAATSESCSSRLENASMISRFASQHLQTNCEPSVTRYWTKR